MAETAIVYKNVADGLDTVEESTESIISTMMAYGIQADDTMGIIDRFNAVGNNFAITSAGIGEAMQRSASALKEGGNSIDESIGLITAANSVIQNPEQVGTALKTLALRLRGAKVELEEAGLDVENMAESTSTLQAKLKALTHGKVDIMIDANTFKNTTQILREMSAVWEDMTDIEQASALELMGGKRQANILSSVISNFETVEDVIETSVNSQGSALTENAKWLDSIEGKTYQFKNALETMWSNMVDSETAKSFIDFGTKAIQFLDTAPGKIVAVTAALTGIAKLKGFSLLGLGQDKIKDFNNIKTAYSTLGAVSQFNPVGASMSTASIQAYANAVSALTPKVQANMLASQGLSKAQIQLAMQYNGLSDDVIREATAHNFAKQAKDQEAMSDQQLLAYKIQLSAASLKLTGDTDALAAAEFLEANASKLASAADAEQIIMSSNLTAAQKAAALSALNQSSANMTLAKSFKAMFASNPVGMILTIATTILSIAIPIINELHKSAEDLTQAADEAISKYKESQSTLKEQKKTIDELADSYERLSSGVDLDTNENLNLTTKSYQEYLDICNDIADIYPHLVTGFDAQGNAILSLRGNVDELIQAYKDAAQASRQKLISSGDDVFSNFKNQTTNFSGLPRQVEIAKKLLEAINSGNEDVMQDTYDTYFENYYTAFGEMIESAGLEWGDFRSWWTGNVDVEKFQQTAPKLLSFIKSTTTQINTETSKVKSLMDAYLGEDLDYAALSEKSRSLIGQVVSGLNAEFIHSFDSADALYNWIKTNIVDAFKDQSVVDAISDLSELQLNFRKGDINYADYQKQLSEYLSKIQNKFDDKTLTQIKVGIGIDETSLQTAEKHIATMLNGLDKDGNIIKSVQDQINSLSISDLQIAGQLEVPADTILSWEELVKEIEKAKIAATKDFDITNFTNAISAHSAVITEYQEALQKLDKGTFTMDDFMELIKQYPELAKGVDISSNAFLGLSRNLKGAIKTSTKNFISQLKELRAQLVAAEKSTDSINQLIEAIENMPEDALDGTIQKYSTLAEKIDSARRAQDKLSDSMGENPNEGYETRGEAMEYMKEAMKRGEIGSESNLWNVAAKYGFTYDSAKTINENADALAKYIAIREKWFKTADDGDDRTNDEYSYKGTESFIKDVESAVANNAELQQYLTWDYDENTGTLNFDYNNEDWDTIVSILSKTKELAGLTSDEFSDMMIQIGQYFGIDWGNYDDVLSHLNKIATGTSDAKTKVEEYGKAMQDHFGENSDVDLTTRPMVKFDSTNFKEWEKHYQDIINNPDGHSEADVQNANEQLAAIQSGNSYATVYSSTFSNEDGTKSVVVTPILPDGKVLSPEDLEKYADKLLAGEELDPDIKIKLAEFDGSNSIQKADEYAQALHEAQAEYDTLRDTLKINTTIDEKGIAGLKEIKEVQSSITQKADGTIVIDEDAFREALTGAKYTEGQIDIIIDKIKTLNKEAFNIDPLNIDEKLIKQGTSGLEDIAQIRDSLTKDAKTGITIFDTDMFASVLREAGYTEDKIDSLIKKIQEYDNIVSVSGNTDPLGLNNAKISVDNLRASLNALNVEYKGSDKKVKIDVEDLVTVLKQRGWTDASIKEYITKLSTSTNLDGFEVKIKGIEDIDEIIQTVNNEVPEEKTTEYEVTGTGADTLDGIESQWTEVTKDKTTNYTIVETTVKKTEDETKPFNLFDPSTWVNGTANVQGTAYKGGSWGAPQTETALVGELGPELLVRNGRWTTVGENGAEFTNVKKGDIIFNHKQTESLLKNGYVTGRGKAYASGTAFAEGDGTFSRYEFSENGGYVEYDVNGNVVDIFGDATAALSDALDDAADSVGEFEEALDWIEIRMEEYGASIGKLEAQLENLVTASEKNAKIEELLAENKKKYADETAGAAYYDKKAESYLVGMSDELIAAAKNGAIAISDFTKEHDEATVNAIKKYREYAGKANDLEQQAEETLTKIATLAAQAIKNIEDEYNNKTSVKDSKMDQLDAQNEYSEAKYGSESAAIYQEKIGINNNKITDLTSQRDEMQAKLDEKVQSGEIKKYSPEWYDAVNSIAAVDTEIIKLQTDTEKYQDSINEIHWDHFENEIGRIHAVSEEADNLLDILSEKDMVNDDGEWTDEGITSLGLYAQKMEAAEVESQRYQEEIDNLNANWQDLGYTEQEYLDKLGELKTGQYDAIKSYQDSKKAIKDLNKERIEAIKNGIDKEIDAYKDLADAKKEELSAEKELYDFQKNVKNQQKNIADIERQLAALANDNSASARAKRAQLQAELAEAKAGLEDTYYERSINNQQKALDKEVEAFEEAKEKEKEALDESAEDTEKVVAEGTETAKENAGIVAETLEETSEKYGLDINKNLSEPWNEGINALQTYTEQFGDSDSATKEELQKISDAYADVMAEIENTAASDIEKINENFETYVKAENPVKPEKPQAPDPNAGQKPEEGTIKVGGQINAGNAKIYDYINSAAENQYFAKDPVYKVLAIDGDWIQVRHHSLQSGVTGWFKKGSVKALATGTTKLKKSGIVNIDELGEELVLRAQHGRLTYLEKGSGVIPADLTSNLMEWGQLDPTSMLEQNQPSIGVHPEVHNTEIHIDNSIAELIHIDHCDQGTLPDVQKMIDKALDKHTQKLNQSLRKYTR